MEEGRLELPKIEGSGNPLIPQGMQGLLIVIAAIILLSVIGFVVIKGGELMKRRVLLPPAGEILPTIEETTPAASPTVVIVTPEASPSPTEAATPSAQRIKVNISSSGFQPANITTGRGSTIVWTNQDTVSHTVTAEDGRFDSGNIAPGDSFEQKFEKIRSYSYSCRFHQEMKGMVRIQ